MDSRTPPAGTTADHMPSDPAPALPRPRTPAPVGFDEATLRAWMLRNLFPSVLPDNHPGLQAQPDWDTTSTPNDDMPEHQCLRASPWRVREDGQGSPYSETEDDRSSTSSRDSHVESEDDSSTIASQPHSGSEEDFVIVSRSDIPPRDTSNDLPNDDSGYEFINSEDVSHSSYNGLPSAAWKYDFVSDPGWQAEQKAWKHRQAAKVCSSYTFTDWVKTLTSCRPGIRRSLELSSRSLWTGDGKLQTWRNVSQRS